MGQQQVAEACLIDEIVDIHRGSGGTYGQPRVTRRCAGAGGWTTTSVSSGSWPTTASSGTLHADGDR